MDLRPKDTLLIVDVQRDFVDGSLAVPGAAAIVPVINRYASEFARRLLPVVATRDWHPPRHVSFAAQGGPWPAHCVAGTPGAGFAAALALPEETLVVSKATDPDRDAYSAFEGTHLDKLLFRLGTRRLFACGLATDYCVLETVRDALRLRFEVVLLTDAIRAVDAHPGDGERALQAMLREGAGAARLADLAGVAPAHG